MKLYKILEDQLKKENNFISDDGELKKWVVLNRAQDFDERLIELLLENKELKEKFFVKVKETLVFNQNLFIQFLEQKNYLNDSYTQYKNKVGLTINGKYLKQRNEVALVWPFKDCILEGGQSKEEDKKEEIFFNEILAQDEITQLLESKVLTGAKTYDKDGEHEFNGFTRDAELNKNRNLPENTITDNLIIKGNNLLALHSLKKEFARKVKLIYIDPPYNTGNDGFKYNDNFNHSSWLTFMKNRLEIAKTLLRDDGVIFVQCDDNEQAYLKILMDEVFTCYQSMITIQVKSPSGDSSKNESLMEDTCEYILCYSKSNYMHHNNPQQIKEVIDKDSNTVKQYKTLIKCLGKASEEFFEFEIGQSKKKETIRAYKVKNFDSETIPTGSRTQKYYRENIDSIGRTAAFSGAFKKAFENKKDIIYVFKYTTTRGKMKGVEQTIHVVNGEQLIYLKDYSKEVKFNGEKQLVKMEKITNFINDISWQGIAGEGEIVLKKGKKPEELLKRIIEWTTKEGDLVLDFHLGSGTTAAVAHKMGRQYIGIEQMDYIETVAVQRLKKVIEGEQGGISKSLNWQGGGAFTYLELKKYNQTFIEQIEEAKDSETLLNIWEQMKEKSFLNYNVDLKKQDAHIDEFKQLALAEQKKHLAQLLDKNQLYVNLSSLNDTDFECTEKEKQISLDFYKLKKD